MTSQALQPPHPKFAFRAVDRYLQRMRTGDGNQYKYAVLPKCTNTWNNSQITYTLGEVPVT